MAHNLRILWVESTPTEREIVHCIQQIRLSFTIMTDKTIQLSRQIKRCRLYILIINDGEFL